MKDLDRILDVVEKWDETPETLRGTPETFCGKDTQLAGQLRAFLHQRNQLGRTLSGEDATPQPEELISRDSSSRYRLVRFHDAGGLGWVYEGVDAELHRPVAVKCLQPLPALDPQSRRRFVREAEVTAKLEHPGIVPIYGFVPENDLGQPYYAMRFVQGETLRDAIRQLHSQRHTIDWRSLEALRILRAFCDLCNTIAYAHSREIVHRDLKTVNIMLGPFGETLVLDWGLAKSIHEPEETPVVVDPLKPQHGPQSQVGEVLGTIGFMSPEQARGETKQIGPHSDIFSLGAILYQILTDRPLYWGDGAHAAAKVGSWEPPHHSHPKTPKGLEAICVKALNADSTQRYRSARDMKDDVERFISDSGVSCYRENIWELTLRGVRKYRQAVVITGISLLLMVLMLSFFLSQSFQQNHELLISNERWKKAVEKAELAEAEAANQTIVAEQARVIAEQKASENEELVERLASVFMLADPRFYPQVNSVADLVNVVSSNPKFFDGMSDKRQFELKLMFARSALGNGLNKEAITRLEELKPLAAKVLEPADIRRLHIDRDLAMLLQFLQPDRSIQLLDALYRNKLFPIGQRLYVGLKEAEVLHNQKQTEKAKALLEEALAATVDLPKEDEITPFRLKMLQARILYESGEAEKALPLCEVLCASVPRGVAPMVAMEPTIQLAECLAKMSRWKEALQQMRIAEEAYIKAAGANHPATREVMQKRQAIETELKKEKSSQPSNDQ